MKQAILESLEYLLKNPPKRSSVGICSRVKDAFTGEEKSSVYSELNEIFKGWEHHSGETFFPIKSSNKKFKTAKRYYLNKTANLWRGRQKQYRISLIKYSIKKLREELNE